MGLEPVSVCASMCLFTLSNMNISETSWSIEIKFYLKHHLGEGKAALGFGPNRIRILVSMATDSSHRVIMGNFCEHSSSFILAHLSRRLWGSLQDGTRAGVRPLVCPSVRPFTLSNMNISETSRLIEIKFHTEHH